MATPSSTNVNPPATQLYNDHQKIPEDFPHLDDAPDRLQGLYDYDSWSFFIKSTLKSAGLKQFTHICTRPPLSDPSYGLWRRTSLRVTNWLVHQLSSDFLSRLVAFKRAQANSRPQTSSSSSSRFPPNFADTMWTTIRRVALHQITGEQAQSCEEAYLRCIHANRVGYPLARTFVNDFWYHVYLSNLLDCKITPYCAALLLLRELRHDLRRLGDLKLARLEEEDAPREYSWKEFDALCHLLVE